ncbi:MAG: hypothetical protein IKW74_05370 [Thermoguttaceae bacterium]|nr:hypothetical protein [Thermoguttaceae bacterium]
MMISIGVSACFEVTEADFPILHTMDAPEMSGVLRRYYCFILKTSFMPDPS